MDKHHGESFVHSSVEPKPHGNKYHGAIIDKARNRFINEAKNMPERGGLYGNKLRKEIHYKP